MLSTESGRRLLEGYHSFMLIFSMHWWRMGQEPSAAPRALGQPMRPEHNRDAPVGVCHDTAPTLDCLSKQRNSWATVLHRLCATLRWRSMATTQPAGQLGGYSCPCNSLPSSPSPPLCWGKRRSVFLWNPSPTAMTIQCQARSLEAWERARKPPEQDCTISAHTQPQSKGRWPWHFPTVCASAERKGHYHNRVLFVPLHLLSTLKQKKHSETAHFSGCLWDRMRSAVLPHVVSCHQPLTCCAWEGRSHQTGSLSGKVGELYSHKILQVPGLSWAAIESRQFLI